jgi:cytochrome c peroxidase
MYAITSFERTMLSASSPWDKYEAGDLTAVSDAAVRGRALYASEKYECYHCHLGETYTTSFQSANTPPPPRDMRNTGLYNIDGKGSYPPINTGLFDFTHFPGDMGKFKVPTLRNVEKTAPYFHDGSAATLEEVLQVYVRGGRLIQSGPYAGDGANNLHRDTLVSGVYMATADEISDLLAFLRSLTDSDFINNPRYANPRCPDDLPSSCPATAPSFAGDVAPVFARVCGAKCHAPNGIAANRPLVDYASIFALKDAVLNQVSVCNMPPADADPTLGEADRSTILAWIVCGAPNN